MAFVMSQKPFNLLPPTLLLALSALLSRALGVLRDHMLAGSFGATAGEGIYNLDVYYAAFRVPDMLYNLLIFGAISAAFIPIFSRYKKSGDHENMWRFANAMLHLMLIAICALSAVAYFFAPALAHLVAGGLGAEELALTTRLMRIMLVSPILFTASSVIISLQDSFRTFFFRSLGPLFYNLGIIFGVLWWGTDFGVVGVTWGVVLGAIAQFLIQLPALWLVGFRYRPVLGWKRPDVRQALKLMGPRVLGLTLFQVTLMINTLIASFLSTGAITIFYFADNLQAVPLGLIGISFAITSFSTLSELAAEPTTEKFTAELRRVMGKILFLIVPASAGLFVLRHEVVDVILVSGKFHAGDAELTAAVLGILIVSLFAQSLIPTLSRGFYAYHDTKTPLYVAIAGSLINIIASLLFAFPLGFGLLGVAAGFSAGAIFHGLLLLSLMQRHVQKRLVDFGRLFAILAASALMGAAVYFGRTFVFFGNGMSQKIIALAILVTLGAAVYFGAMSVTKKLNA